MNYYERYVGDFQRDTGDLSCAQVGAYDRLLDHYYAKEEPLPADYASLFRIARAMEKGEQQAVKSVADQFFPIGPDGLRHNDRADREIAKARNRIQSSRDNGKKGGRPSKTKPKENQIETQEKPSGFQSANPPETHDGVHHVPHAIKEPRDEAHAISSSPVGTPAGAVCARLKSEARLLDVNPSHPKLLALLEVGLTDDEIIAAGHEAHSKGKGFAYALAVAEGRRRDAANIKPLPPQAAEPQGRGRLSPAGQQTYEAGLRWLESTEEQS